MLSKKLELDTVNNVLGGVCSGLAKYTGTDVGIIRFLTVISTFVTGGFIILLYIIAWICFPKEQ